MKIVVEISQVKIWKFGFLRLTSFAETWYEMWDHVFKKSTSGVISDADEPQNSVSRLISPVKMTIP